MGAYWNEENDVQRNLRDQDSHGGDERVDSSIIGVNPWGSSIKLEFPKFNGVGLEGWLLRAKYFFEVVRIYPQNMVKITTLHLEGRAVQWASRVCQD